MTLVPQVGGRLETARAPTVPAKQAVPTIRSSTLMVPVATAKGKW